MKLQNLSTRAFLRLIVGGASMTSILLLFILYAFTKDIRMILGGFSVMILLFLWGAVFLHYFQKKLSVFTDGLCRTLDEMMDSTVRPQINYEAETLLARISHRLERLYHVMQETRHKVEEEKAELQSLVSDISHQTKTPIANLKMLNDTMLTRSETAEAVIPLWEAIPGEYEEYAHQVLNSNAGKKGFSYRYISHRPFRSGDIYWIMEHQLQELEVDGRPCFEKVSLMTDEATIHVTCSEYFFRCCKELETIFYHYSENHVEEL